MIEPSTQGIAGLFHHLDLGLSQYHLDTRGPYSGDHVITDDSDGISIANCSGIAIQAYTIPREWGHKLWFNGLALGLDWAEDEYSPPWVRLSWVAENVFGHKFLYQRDVGSHILEPYYFDQTIPAAILVHCEPGWQYDVYTIRV